MTSVNITENKYSVSVTEGATTVVTVKAPGPQGIQGAAGAGISAGDKGALTVAANLTDWTLNKPIDLGDNEKIRFGDSQDLQIYHDGTASYFADTGSGVLKFLTDGFRVRNGADNENLISAVQDGAVELYYDNVKRCETSADGLDLPDNSKLQLGDSQDLQIFHDGSHSVIKDAGTGMLKMLGSTISIKNGQDNKNCAIFSPNGAASLFHNNLKKVETTSTGITVTGSVTTQDMNMSNLNGIANEVDGSKGSWSIQEGADDLFLINRVNGKKYKFNLTEIS